MAEKELKAAKVELAQAKTRLDHTVAQLKARLSPATLATDTFNDTVRKVSGYSGQGVGAVRDRPAAYSAGAAAIGLFLFRKPIAHLLVRAFGTSPPKGRVKADLTRGDDFDLTAPVLKKQG